MCARVKGGHIFCGRGNRWTSYSPSNSGSSSSCCSCPPSPSPSGSCLPAGRTCSCFLTRHMIYSWSPPNATGLMNSLHPGEYPKLTTFNWKLFTFAYLLQIFEDWHDHLVNQPQQPLPSRQKPTTPTETHDDKTAKSRRTTLTTLVGVLRIHPKFITEVRFKCSFNPLAPHLVETLLTLGIYLGIIPCSVSISDSASAVLTWNGKCCPSVPDLRIEIWLRYWAFFWQGKEERRWPADGAEMALRCCSSPLSLSVRVMSTSERNYGIFA